MKKNKTQLLAFSLIALTILTIFVSCDKDDDDSATVNTTCDAKGSYSGTYTNQNNQTATFAYVLTTNNFISGAGNLSSAPTAFGGYENTCDSIKLRSWNSINGNYYYFAGKFSNNRATITGIYKNLTTTSEMGTFTLTKQ